jgi:Family of unknown function (DUF6281)
VTNAVVRSQAFVAGIAVVLAAAGCGGAPASAPAVEASCANVVEWRGSRYLGHGVRLPVRTGAELEPATRLDCDDGSGASPDDEIRVARLAGVDPSVALATSDDPRVLYLREGHEIETGPLAPALAGALYGPTCEPERPFTLEGTFIGSSNLDEEFSVTIDVDAAEGEGRPYLGLPIFLLVHDSTEGLNERDAFRPRVGEEWRLRATVGCVPGERPTQTFLAARVERVEKHGPPADLGSLHCPGATDAAPCENGAEVGVSYPFDFYVHCGVRDAYFDGRWWVLAGGPLERDELRPSAISDPWVRGPIRLIARDEAEFSGGRFKLALVPPRTGYERAACD